MNKIPPRITPRLLDEVFTDEVLEVLPSNKNIKRGVSAYYRSQNPAYRDNLSKALKGKPKTQTQIENRKLSMPDQSGENNPFFGKSHSHESIEKMKNNLPDRHGKNNSFYGKNHNEETRKKMSKPRSESGKANMRGPREKKICPHCGLEGSGGNMGRYHFDNCKSK